jgi:hypothetical protein
VEDNTDALARLRYWFCGAEESAERALPGAERRQIAELFEKRSMGRLNGRLEMYIDVLVMKRPEDHLGGSDFSGQPRDPGRRRAAMSSSATLWTAIKCCAHSPSREFVRLVESGGAGTASGHRKCILIRRPAP